MKARIKATGEIVEVVVKTVTPIGSYEPELRWINKKSGISYSEDELFLSEYICDAPDYWDRLIHQAAITAMQGIMSNPVGFESIRCTSKDHDKKVAEIAICFAKELVEGLKLIRSN